MPDQGFDMLNDELTSIQGTPVEYVDDIPQAEREILEDRIQSAVASQVEAHAALQVVVVG